MQSYYGDIASSLVGDNNTTNIMNFMFDFTKQNQIFEEKQDPNIKLKHHLEAEKTERHNDKDSINSSAYLNETTEIMNESIISAMAKKDFNLKKEMDMLIRPEKVEREKRMSKLKPKTEFKWEKRGTQLVRVPMLNEDNKLFGNEKIISNINLGNLSNIGNLGNINNINNLNNLNDSSNLINL